MAGLCNAIRLICRLMLIALVLTAAPARATPPKPDSLRELLRWPRAAQLRLARANIDIQSAPVIIALLRRPELARPVRAELLANLAGYFLHENQPSLAIVQMLQTRQMAL